MTLEITRPWARASDTGDRCGGFLTVANASNAPDRLVSASSTVAKRVFVCGIKVVGSQIAMRTLVKGLAIPAETTITLRPRGYHLLMLGLKRTLKSGDVVPVTLTFEKAGNVDVALAVQAPGPVGKETLLESR